MSKAMSRRKEVTVSRPGAHRKTRYVLAAGSAIVILFGIFFSSQKPPAPPALGLEQQATANQPAGAGALASVSPFLNFGKISMAAGKVSHRYSIRNTGEAPLTITRLSTSCMCTVATLITQAGKKGPFGMSGHGFVPGLAERLAPGESAQVEVVFDPAAHGPAGIGPTDRTVTIVSDAGLPLVLRFSAAVTP